MITDLALSKAQAILRRECSPIGLMASLEGYPHVWARDSVITALGALSVGEAGRGQPAGRRRGMGVQRMVPRRDGAADGVSQQGWSAGMCVLAYHCVADGSVPILVPEPAQLNSER